MPVYSDYSLSILNNTNIAYSQTNDDLSTLRPNSQVKFGNDEVYYTVSDVLPLNYIKNYEVLDLKRIKIKEDNLCVLAKGDLLNLSFKEYELLAVYNIQNPGQNYKVNDILYLPGGIPSFNVKTGTREICSIKVNDITEKGGVRSFGIINKGKYTSSPNKIVNLDGGNGTDCILDLDYKLTENRTYIERTIVFIDKTNHLEQVLYLDYEIPSGVVLGKISLNKYQIFLSGLYLGESKFESPFELVGDFTNFLLLPLLVKNSFSKEPLINMAFNRIDGEFYKLSNKIIELENKINLTK